MSDKLLVFAILCALLIAAVVLSLIKKNRLAEEYSSSWLLVAFVTLIASVFSNQIVGLYGLLKGEAGSGPEILLFFALLFLLFFLMYVSVKLSDYKKNIVSLSQEVGNLKYEITALKQKLEK